LRKASLLLFCLSMFGQNAIRGFPPAAVAAERELELRAKL